MIAATVLAAGNSARMGSPKALLDIHGATFLQHILEKLRPVRAEGNTGGRGGPDDLAG